MTTQLSPDIEYIMDAANLQYVEDSSAGGYTRLKWGRGFTYRDEQGNTIDSPQLRTWFESLMIPPAWEEVWICPHENGHLLATGRDQAGRKQYLYHPRWNEYRQQNKFNKLLDFGQHLPAIRQQTDDDLNQKNLNKTRVLALTVKLLELTLIRIGNKQYANRNDTYGLTTLQDEHVTIKGGKVTFEFIGKHSVEHVMTIEDKNLAKIIKACKDVPGYDLLQYYDENGDHHEIGSGDVNQYLRDMTGEDFTAKVFRTWGASARMLQLLNQLEPPQDEEQRQSNINTMIEQVADELGNTVAVCRQYYIHPAIYDLYGSDQWDNLFNQDIPERCYPEEVALMSLIDSLIN